MAPFVGRSSPLEIRHATPSNCVTDAAGIGVKDTKDAGNWGSFGCARITERRGGGNSRFPLPKTRERLTFECYKDVPKVFFLSITDLLGPNGLGLDKCPERHMREQRGDSNGYLQVAHESEGNPKLFGRTTARLPIADK
ncbi:hypothetical protein WA026_007006 [Henosepilachna vigintioctopunctata]|uniref:Uncharacterized protein n=1 Tax=Henosepilachna vigintioctopunctata TaxID=420089 RepID=A0AAW1V1N8_9CUCU